jgi:hypothetical protein
MSTAHFSVCNRKGEFFVDRKHHAVKDMRNSFQKKKKEKDIVQLQARTNQRLCRTDMTIKFAQIF